MDSATSEAIGDAANLDRVSLMVGVTAETGDSIGELMGAFLNTYAPGTRQDVVDQLTPGADFTVQYAGGSVHVIGIPTGDGSIVTLTVDRD